MRHQRKGYLRRLYRVWARLSNDGRRTSPLIEELWQEYHREFAAVRAYWRYHADPRKPLAVAAVGRAIKRGDLIRPASCSECGGSGQMLGHHASYEPEHQLDVEWLCPKCHGRFLK